jgi:hypothetical protein
MDSFSSAGVERIKKLCFMSLKFLYRRHISGGVFANAITRKCINHVAKMDYYLIIYVHFDLWTADGGWQRNNLAAT